MLEDKVAALCWDDISFHISNPVWVEQPERTISIRIVDKQSIKKRIIWIAGSPATEKAKTIAGECLVHALAMMSRRNL